jgi:hypothetical protein
LTILILPSFPLHTQVLPNKDEQPSVPEKPDSTPIQFYFFGLHPLLALASSMATTSLGKISKVSIAFPLIDAKGGNINHDH